MDFEDLLSGVNLRESDLDHSVKSSRSSKSVV